MNRNVKRLYILLLLSPLLGLIEPAAATQASWVFAHRVNTVAALQAANNDQGVNAVEVDVSASRHIRRSKRCSETWCAFHKNDKRAINLSIILRNVKNATNLHAVWLDVKDTGESLRDYDRLYNTVRTELGAGDRAVRKFWGVWPSSETNSNFVRSLLLKLDWLGGNSQNVPILEIDYTNEISKAAKFCGKEKIQCGLSSGNPFLGDLPGAGGPSWNITNNRYLKNALTYKSINSLFHWTFNWGSADAFEDDLIRLMFSQRSYWERLGGVSKLCGLEGNGIIVGRRARVYDTGFCDNSAGDACSEARAAILDGPNGYGNRNANIGRSRNTYTSNLARGC